MSITATHCAFCTKPFEKGEGSFIIGDPLLSLPKELADVIGELAVRNGTPLHILTPEGATPLYRITIHNRCIVRSSEAVMQVMRERGLDPSTLGYNINIDGDEQLSPEEEAEHEAREAELLDPEFIVSILNEHVIGQESAKEILAVALVDHLKRLRIYERNVKLDDSNEDILPPEELVPKKSNVLLVGPSGSGKTELAERIAKIIGVPFIAISATELSPMGFKGTNVDEVIKRLVEAAEGDLAQAETGIIFIDEVDKIREQKGDDSLIDNIRGTGSQHMLLKFLEGDNISFKMDTPDGLPITKSIGTRDILIILGGAFEGLAEAIAKKAAPTRSIGFGAEVDKKDFASVEFPVFIEPQSLIDWGFGKEFVGRIPFIASLNALTESDLVRILTEPKEAIVKQFQALTAEDDIKLTFTKEALAAVAQLAMKRKVGARGLRAILENALFKTRLTLRRKKREEPTLIEVRITEKVIRENTTPDYIYSEPEKKKIAKATSRAIREGVIKRQ